jgi:hypothetical protein
VTTLLARRRPPSEIEQPDLEALPVGCPAWTLCGGYALPDGPTGTMSCPARPAEQFSTCPVAVSDSVPVTEAATDAVSATDSGWVADSVAHTGGYDVLDVQ